MGYVCQEQPQLVNRGEWRGMAVTGTNSRANRKDLAGCNQAVLGRLWVLYDLRCFVMQYEVFSHGFHPLDGGFHRFLVWLCYWISYCKAMQSHMCPLFPLDFWEKWGNKRYEIPPPPTFKSGRHVTRLLMPLMIARQVLRRIGGWEGH